MYIKKKFKKRSKIETINKQYKENVICFITVKTIVPACRPNKKLKKVLV